MRPVTESVFSFSFFFFSQSFQENIMIIRQELLEKSCCLESSKLQAKTITGLSKTCYLFLRTSQCGGGGRHTNQTLWDNVISDLQRKVGATCVHCGCNGWA